MAKREVTGGQPTPRPPEREPGVEPPNPGVEPEHMPPDIPVPDPAPPPAENPGDKPLPPLTDPDVVDPGEPVPPPAPWRAGECQSQGGAETSADLAWQAEGECNQRSDSALGLRQMADLMDQRRNPNRRPLSQSANSVPQVWRSGMTSTKPVEDVSQDFAADLAALRDDVTKLSSSISEFIRAQTASTANSVFNAVDNTRQKVVETAGRAQDGVAQASSELEATIERNPLAAVAIALGAGILIGLLSRGRK